MSADIRSASAPQRTRSWCRLWFSLVALVGLAALVLQLILLVMGGQDANSGDTTARVGLATRLVRFFSYFTVESNIFATAMAITVAIDPNRDGPVWRVLRLTGLFGIFITGLVFDLVLAPLIHLNGAAQVANIGLHYLVPWLSVVGWLLFGPRPRISWATVRWAFLWPILWLGWTYLHGAITHFYPYDFLNPDLLGFPTALRNVAGVVLVGAVVILLAKLGDKLPTIDR